MLNEYCAHWILIIYLRTKNIEEWLEVEIMARNKIKLLLMAIVPLLSILMVGVNGLTSMTVQAQTQHDKKYIIATDTTFAPFEFVDESGEMVGIDMDILAAIAEDQGFEYEIRPLGFNAALQALESKQVDGVIAGMSITPDRQKMFDFSEAYYNSSLSFAVKEDSDIESLEDLDGKRVAVKTGTQGSELAEELQEQYGYEIVTFEDSVNMYEDVMVGNSDAAVEDFPVQAYAIASGQVDLRQLEESFDIGSYGFAVGPDENSALLEAFNKGLANIQASGEYDEILRTYLGDAGTATNETVDSMIEHEKTYVIATDTTFAPFEFVDESGEMVGIDMDILAAIAKDQGFEYEVRPLGFNAALQALESKQVDGVIAGMSITPERAATFDFSEAYYNSSLSFAVKGDSDIQSLEDLDGKRVAVKTGTQGSELAEELQEQYGYEIVTFEDSVNMYEDVMVGNSDAAVEDYPVQAYAIASGQIDLRQLEETFDIGSYGFAVNPGENQALLDAFNQGLKNIQASGEYDEILSRYLGDAPETTEEALVHDKTYIIATDNTYAPFEFEDESGNLVGIDMDLMAAIAEDQGFEYEMRVLGFNAAVQALESQQADGVIAGMSITPEREDSFDFSEPYYQSSLSFMVQEDSDIQTLEDLKGKRIAVKTGTQGNDLVASMQEEYDFEIVVFEDTTNMYEEVIVGNSDAAVEDYPVISYAINSGQVPLRTLEETFDVGAYGFAVLGGENATLLEAFNRGLSKLQASGEYDKIVSDYIGTQASEADVNETNSDASLNRAPASSVSMFSQFQQNFKPLMNGLWTTVWVTLVSILFAMIIGITLGIMNSSFNPFLRLIAMLYVDIMRGIPLIVLSFFIYFGIPQFTGWTFPATTAGIITLSLNAAAYIAEIVRGGINAVPVGQSEASRSLGLPYGKTLQYVILPQAFKIMIPSFINQFVITLKDTSILSVIGLVELTQTGKIIIARTYQSGSMWLIVGIMYIVIITALTRLSKRLEKEN